MFLLSNDSGYFFPAPMLEYHRLADESMGKIFKLVDPINGYFVILNEKFEFFPLIDEVERILALTRRMETARGLRGKR